MSDPLRTRIAAVQAQHHHWDYAGALTCACGETFGLGVEAGWEAAVVGWAIHLADAVIKELGLRQEWAVADADGDHVYVGSVEENADRYTIQPGDHKEIRYVTDWKPNDE